MHTGECYLNNPCIARTFATTLVLLLAGRIYCGTVKHYSVGKGLCYTYDSTLGGAMTTLMSAANYWTTV